MRKEKYIGLLVAVFVTMMMFSAIPAAGQEKEAYAVLTYNTLTFRYDNKKPKTTNAHSISEMSESQSSQWKNKVEKVVFDETFKDYKPANCASWFSGCTNLIEIVDMDKYLNTENVKTMKSMFSKCEKLTNLDVSHFCTANVTNMASMFAQCIKLTYLDISAFDTKNVTDMSSIFYKCNELTTLNVSNFNTGNVTNMSRMFSDCYVLKDLDVSHFNTEKVTDMSNMFEYCQAITAIDVSNFNTTNVTKMVKMFNACGNLIKLDLSSFNTKNVTDMKGMFERCCNLEYLNISNFNTENVTTMSSMFEECNNLKIIDVSRFNTVQTTDMSRLFFDCYSLSELDVRNFNTENVANMNYMFAYCNGLTSLDLSSFNTKNVTNIYGMFYRCGNLKTIYAEDTWTTTSVSSSSYLFDECYNLAGGNGTKYDPNKTDGSYACIDGYKNSPGYFSMKKDIYPYVVLSDDGVLTFKYDGNRPLNAYRIAYKDWQTNWAEINKDVKTVVFDESFKDYKPTKCKSWFSGCINLTEIQGMEYLNTEQTTDMASMFAECSSLKTIDLSMLNTQNVTSMSGMFSDCKNLKTLNLSGFNTENVTSMSYIFYGCSSLTSLDLSVFNTENVTSMSYMFYGCSSLASLDLSGFNTKNVTSMNSMFEKCNFTKLDLSNFDTKNVTTMKNMFFDCVLLSNINLSSFNVENVGNMSEMFAYCRSLKALDLRSFNVKNNSSVGGMFERCSNLHTICVNQSWYDYDNGKTIYGGNMFTECYQLEGCQGTKYPTDDVAIYYLGEFGQSYAIVDDGTNNHPGFFSLEFPVVSIKISEYPQKEYYEGEELDLSKGTLVITYEDGATNTIPLSEANVTGFNSTIKDTDKYLTLTVEYQKQITIFDVTIHKLIVEKIEITKLPEKTEYIEGQKLDLKGGEATLKYNNGATEVIELSSNKITASGFNREAIGNQTISVSIGNCSATFEVTVKEKTANDIILSQIPQNNYLVGQELDLSAGKIIVMYDNGTTSIIDFSSANISGYDPNKIGEQTVTVEYLGLKTEFTVTVNEKKEDSNNEPTPISEISASKGIKIWSADRTIYADNVVGNTGIRITDITGHLVKSIKATNDRMEIPMQTSGIYIVKIGTKTQKVIIQ